MDPRIQIPIRIHPKMSWIRNTDLYLTHFPWISHFWIADLPSHTDVCEKRPKLLTEFSECIAVFIHSGFLVCILKSSRFSAIVLADSVNFRLLGWIIHSWTFITNFYISFMSKLIKSTWAVKVFFRRSEIWTFPKSLFLHFLRFFNLDNIASVQDPSINKQNSKTKNLDFYTFVPSYELVVCCKCTKDLSKKNLGEKNLFFVGILKATEEKSRIRIHKASPDPYQNVTDPELWPLQIWLRSLDFRIVTWINLIFC